MVVNSAAASHLHLASRNAPGSGLAFEIELRPFGCHDIASPRSGECNQPVGQSHPGRDRSYLRKSQNLSQFLKTQERRMMDDLR